jgi:hypothetical protein
MLPGQPASACPTNVPAKSNAGLVDESTLVGKELMKLVKSPRCNFSVWIGVWRALLPYLVPIATLTILPFRGLEAQQPL